MKTSLKKLVYRVERQLYRRGVFTGNATLPHFLGLGPGQTGTTWLARHLNDHPDVYITPKKETYYFCRWFDHMSLHDYAAMFSDGEDRICGEITPGYSIMSRDRIADVARLMPDVRLILTLRNPIDRSWSAARRVMPALGTTIDDITDEMLFAYLDKEWSYQAPNGARLTGDYEAGLLEGHYTRIIDNWCEHFPAKQLLLVLFDDIIAEPAETLARVCRHIGADPDRGPTSQDLTQPVNSNPPYPLPERVRGFLENKYRAEIEALAARLGPPVSGWLPAEPH